MVFNFPCYENFGEMRKMTLKCDDYSDAVNFLKVFGVVKKGMNEFMLDLAVKK